MILAAAVLLLVVAGEVRYCQHHKHSGSTSLLSVPFCAGESALAHRFTDAVTPAVNVSSKASTQEVGGALCPITADQIPWRGRYATLQPVVLSVRETLGELMTVTMPYCTSCLLLYVHFHVRIPHNIGTILPTLVLSLVCS